MSERVLYRYEDVAVSTGYDEWGYSSGSRVELYLREYPVLRETPKGVWISLSCGEFHALGDQCERFVLLGARRRFACPTREEALDSFLARKRRQLSIHKARIRHVESAIAAAEDVRRRAAVPA